MYKINLKSNKNTLAGDIQTAMAFYTSDGNKMFNFTRMVFYMEHGLQLPTSDLIVMLAKLKRITLINYVLTYVISDIGGASSIVIKDAFEHYYEFGKFYINLEMLPVFPIIPAQDLQLI